MDSLVHGEKPMTEHVYHLRVGLPYSIFAFVKEMENRYPEVEKFFRESYIAANALDLLHDLSMFHNANYTIAIDYPAGIAHISVKELAQEAQTAIEGAHVVLAAGLESFTVMEHMRKTFELSDYEEVVRMAYMHTADLANALLSNGRLFLAQPKYTFSPENVYTPEFLHPFRSVTFQ